MRPTEQLRIARLRLLPVILAVMSLAVFAENPAAATDLFVDRAEELGADFVHFAGVSGEFYIVEISGPGCGMLDYDNDGDTDVLLENCNGRARLLLNPVGNANHWFGLRVVAGNPARDQIGAWVGVHPKGKTVMWRRVRTDGGYASANDPRLVFGLGGGTAVDRVEVHWPDGTVEVWADVPLDRYTTLTKGGGTKATSKGPKS